MRSPKIDQLINELVDMGCDCDIMYGYGCSIHELGRELKKEIEDCYENMSGT